MMRCIGNTWMCTALIFAVVGCMQIDPNFDSGYGRLFLSKEGVLVGESISKVSRNGKWYYGVDIDKDATFGALWNVIVNPDEEKVPFGEVAGDKEDLHNFLGQFMPKVGELQLGKTCMYSMSPDGDFIIDVHPKHKNIAFAGGFSGHGFKFASAVGEALKDLVTAGTTKVDLEAFSLKRFLVSMHQQSKKQNV